MLDIFPQVTHNEDMNINFGSTLDKIMKEQNLNQLQLARLLDIRQSQVSNWLNGKSLPGYYSLKILCIKLKVSADHLLDIRR